MNQNKRADGVAVSLSTIVDGESLLVKVRKVHKDVRDPEAGFKPSIELAEFIENDKRPISAVAELNDDDDRFAQALPQHAFQPVSLANAIAEGWITQEAFDALSPSKGVSVEGQEEGKHFVTVNRLNPSFKGKRLRVQILETIETNRKGVQAKINPKTGQTVLHAGKPVYRIAQVAYEGNHASHFLASDNTTALLTGVEPKIMEIPENTPSENFNQ